MIFIKYVRLSWMS